MLRKGGGVLKALLADQFLFLTKIVIIVLSISLNMCCWCSEESYHWDGSLEYPQHMFYLRNKKHFLLYVYFFQLSTALDESAIVSVCEIPWF